MTFQRKDSHKKPKRSVWSTADIYCNISLSCLRVSALGKFTMDSVRLEKDNGTLWVKRFLPGFLVSVVGSSTRIMSASNSLQIHNPPLPLPPSGALERAYRDSVNDSLLPMGVED